MNVCRHLPKIKFFTLPILFHCSSIKPFFSSLTKAVFEDDLFSINILK